MCNKHPVAFVLRSVDSIGYSTIESSRVLPNHHGTAFTRPLCNFVVVAHHKGVYAFYGFEHSARCECRK
jgi:hypothetical protein